MKQNCRTGMVGAGVGRALDVRALVKVLAISVLMMCATLFGAFGPAQAWAEGLSEAPAHTKRVSSQNEDGSYTLSLDVTGQSETSEESKPADVIVVLDISNSMNEYFRGNQTRLDVAKNRINELIDGVLASGSDNRVAIATFEGNTSSAFFVEWDYAYNDSSVVVDWATSGEAGAAKRTVNAISTPDGGILVNNGSGGTNWQAGVRSANELLSSRRQDAETYVVFISDGNPGYYYGRGLIGGDGWPHVDDGYTVGVGSPSNWQQSKPAYDAAVKEANSWTADNFYSVSIGGDVDRMESFANDLGGEYFDGTTADGFESAIDSIISSITHNYTYQNVSITDTLSEWVTLQNGVEDDGTIQNAQITAAWADPEAHQGEEAPTVPEGTTFKRQSDGSLKLAFPGSFKLQDGVTYTVSFNVTLAQKAYDEKGGQNVPTNSGATVAYSIVTDDQAGDLQTSPYETPEVAVPASELTITKKWSDGNENHADDSVTVQIKQDDKNYGEPQVLSAENGWSVTVSAPAGPDGHIYTVEEQALEGYTSEVEPGSLEFKGLSSKSGAFTVTNAPTTGTLVISKVLEKSDLAAPDSIFTFKVTVDGAGNNTYGDVQFTNNVATVTLKAGEIKEIAGLPKNAAFSVEETNLPTGFVQKSVTDDSGDNKSDGKGTVEASKTATVTVTNEYQGVGLKIFKYTTDDGTKTPLPNAEFTVTNDSGYSKTVKTGDDGYASFTGLGDGVYTISETKVPAGFSKAPDRTLTITGDTAKLAYKDSGELIGDPIKLAGGVFSISIENTGVSSLPTTGGSGSIVIPAIGVSMVAVAGWYLARKAKITR